MLTGLKIQPAGVNQIIQSKKGGRMKKFISGLAAVFVYSGGWDRGNNQTSIPYAALGFPAAVWANWSAEPNALALPKKTASLLHQPTVVISVSPLRLRRRSLDISAFKIRKF